MKIKSSLILMGMGVMGTLVYQNIRNGKFKKMMKQVNKTKTKMLDSIEDMM